MQAHLNNAAKIFTYLKSHPAVAKIYYPGDPDNPDFSIAKQQMNGFGAMISFELQPGMNPRPSLNIYKSSRSPKVSEHWKV